MDGPCKSALFETTELLHVVEGHHRDLQRLYAGYEELREENGALRDCLEAHGFLSGPEFAMRLHRRRFSRARVAHPCHWEASLLHVVQPNELLCLLAQHSGLSAVGNLASGCRALRDSLACARTAFAAMFPPKLYVLGGFGAGDEVLPTAERLDLQDQKLDALPPVPTPRIGFVAATVHDCVYVVGGMSPQGEVLGHAERYDPLICRWTPVCAMPTPRYEFAAVTVDGHMYAIGGWGGATAQISPGMGLDIPTPRHDIDTPRPGSGVGSTPRSGRGRAWDGVPVLTPRLSFATAIVEGDLMGWLTGQQKGKPLASVERYITEEDRWEVLPPMPTPRWEPAATSLAGLIYVISGQAVGLPPNIVERFDPLQRCWEELAPVPTARLCCAVIALGGYLYVIGGHVDGFAVNIVERYDPQSGKWQRKRAMPTARWSMAVTVAHGAIFVVGGQRSFSQRPCTASERYDPALDQWQTLTPINLQRRGTVVISG